MKKIIVLLTAGMLLAPSFLIVLPFGKYSGWASCLAQNVGINTTGAAPTTPSMLEVLQPSTTANSNGIYISHTGAIAGGTGNAFQALKSGASLTNIAAYLSASGASNNYALIVPSTGGLVGFGLTAPTVRLEIAQNEAVRLGNAYLSSGGDYVHLANNTWYNGAAWTSPGALPGALIQLTGQTTNFYTHNGAGAFTQRMSISSTGAVTIPQLSTLGVVHNSAAGLLSTSLVSLAADITGTLPVGNGGTGATTLTGMLKGNGAAAISAVTGTQWGAAYWSDANTIGTTAAGTAGAFFRCAGAGAPAWSTLLLPNAAATGDIMYASAANTMSILAAGTAGYKLQTNGAAAPTWVAAPSGSGTTDYLARWTSATNLGIGVTRDNNSTVGINVAPNASYNLYVSGALATADNATIYGTSTGANRVYGVLGSASATTTNASGVRGSATGAGLVNGVWGEANGAAAVAGVYGSTTSITNGATGVSGSASGASGIISGVVGFTNSTTTYATGVYGEATVGGADAIDGYNSAAAGASDGYGVWGITLQSAGFGVAANNWNSAGTGVLGMGNNTATFWNPNSAGAGGIFNGLRYGIVSGIDNENTAGTGYGYGAVYSSIEGVTETNVGANATLYHFAIHGINNDYGVAYGLRTGGVLGRESYTGAWGCLGYQTSASANRYGSYATSSTTGAGFLSNSAVTGIGMAGYGGIIGGWTRGEVMGHISAGELFASYNLGNEYTSGFSAEVVTLSDKRVAAYSMTSTDIKVYNDGTGKLNNGKTRVDFDVSFTELIGENKPVVTITPMGQCNGIYITNVDSKGFDVIELNNGNSNVEFSYIAISKRIDSENKPALPTDLANKNFDEKMKGVMFNESDLEHSATSIWWDGTKLSFDPTTKQGDLKPLPGLEVHKKALGLKDGKAAFKKRIINEEK